MSFKPLPILRSYFTGKQCHRQIDWRQVGCRRDRSAIDGVGPSKGRILTTKGTEEREWRRKEGKRKVLWLFPSCTCVSFVVED